MQLILYVIIGGYFAVLGYLTKLVNDKRKKLNWKPKAERSFFCLEEKQEEATGFWVAREEVIGLINGLTALMRDPELEACANFDGCARSIKVKRSGSDFELVRVTNPPE